MPRGETGSRCGGRHVPYGTARSWPQGYHRAARLPLTGGSKSLGPKTPETENIYREFQDGMVRVLSRLAELAARVAHINQVPQTVANVLREMHAQDVLGKNLLLGATNALYAYESTSGCLFDAALTVTAVGNCPCDTQTRLRLAGTSVKEKGLLALLQKTD